MAINDILNSLEQLLEESWNLPLSGGRCVVDAERALALIDEVRNNMPSEIKESRAIVEGRLAIIEGAKKEAEQIIRKAEERARNLVQQEEIVKRAQSQANELLMTANTRAKEIKSAASEYADAIMKDCEDQLNASVNDVRATRQKLKARKG